ncbi:MAG: hypothetical protein R3Y13_03295 [bacterium]
MKKIVLFLIAVMFIVTGCSSGSKEDIVEKFSESINKSDSYLLTGKMEIYDGQDTYTYTLESSYLKEGYYKVILINDTNNHEQIILRDGESVYVVTPSLNKSFKFDSVWPDNSSQAYLLDSILTDIKNDDEHEITELEDGYEIKSAVNYPNNGELRYQVVTFDSDMNIISVEVYDSNENIYITVNFTSIDMNAKLKEEDFSLENYIDIEESQDEETSCMECSENEEDCESDCTVETSVMDSVLYPLYVPSNTSLSSSEKVMTDYNERVILTFSGESNFVLIEEASKISSDFEIIPITGNPVLLNNTIAAISTNSMYFSKNGVDYYILSNDLTSMEMVSIANSVGSIQSVMSTK